MHRTSIIMDRTMVRAADVGGDGGRGRGRRRIAALPKITADEDAGRERFCIFSCPFSVPRFVLPDIHGKPTYRRAKENEAISGNS